MSFRNALFCLVLATVGCATDGSTLVQADLDAAANSPARLQAELTASLDTPQQHSGLLDMASVHRITLDLPERMLVQLDLESDEPLRLEVQGFNHPTDYMGRGDETVAAEYPVTADPSV